MMRDEGWNSGWGWLGSGLMMVLVWGALIALVVVLARRWTHTPAAPAAPSAPVMPATPASRRPTAQEILAERLARGEIDAEDYKARKAALDDNG